MTDDAPPRLIRHDTVFAGRVFHVDRDEIALSNGVVTTLDIVRHRGSVVLVPQPTRETIVLIRQYRHAIGRWIWEVPAGTIEPGEAPESAARRECEEEIGRTPGLVTPLGAYYPTPGFCDEVMSFYRLEELAPLSAPVAHDADEQLEAREMTLGEARRLLNLGEIGDLKTALALALV